MTKPVKQKSWIKRLGGIVAVAVILSGCASQPQAVDEVNDPLEGVNRAVYGFNEVVDTWFLRPAATLYRSLLPPPVQNGIHNMLSNLSTPIILLNDILQGEPDRALNTVSRFAINTTVGVLGFNDPAKDMGFKQHSEDFGQTLAVWGIGEGPYIVLPIFGPSSPRDAIGLVVDYFTDPVNIWANNTDRDNFPMGRSLVSAVDTRAYYYDAIEDMKKNSLDPYVAMRSFYMQRRQAEIMNNDQPKVKAAPSLSFDFDAPSPGDEEITEAR
ncbi:Surface lipoprotein [Candidatus Terasakiella magnetica]|uniref:Surface lipoprotein n=1 Tax=Candidatus Terasakiella magnetica TaxID=1867952 RepID=A0A1C3RKC1_9PROT|nr:VacJ family lipoprotein [Candidatus Terasakiella magnetica]SCA57770.1 Surface lipoprotein [Candidatus Terasakiella magnetica]